MQEISEKKRFGIYKKTGVDVSSCNKKPIGYALISVVDGFRNEIKRVGVDGYALLVHIKKGLPNIGKISIEKIYE